MDIERPHPRDLHKHPVPMQVRLCDAFKARAKAARATFPSAKLGFYGTLIPDGRDARPTRRTWRGKMRSSGRESAACSTRSTACFPLCTRASGRPTGGGRPMSRTRARRSPAQENLARSDGEHPPCDTAPHLLGGERQLEPPRGSAPRPPHSRSARGDASTCKLDVMIAEGVRTAVFWVGKDEDLITRRPNPNNRTVTDFVCSRRPPKVLCPPGLKSSA